MALDPVKLVEKMADAGMISTTGNVYSLKVEELHNSPFQEEAKEVFLNLNGCGTKIPLPDIIPTVVVDDNTFLQFDDHFHFHRYRMITLRSSIYERLKDIPCESYKRYCRTYEKECLKSGLMGGIWSSGVSMKYFGNPEAPGDFFGNGSPGWKMQAYKDFIMDLYALVNGIRIIRISCYDNLLINNQLIRISKLYEGNGNWEYLLKYIHKKLVVT